jgi:hypothetical protein
MRSQLTDMAKSKKSSAEICPQGKATARRTCSHQPAQHCIQAAFTHLSSCLATKLPALPSPTPPNINGESTQEFHEKLQDQVSA